MLTVSSINKQEQQRAPSFGATSIPPIMTTGELGVDSYRGAPSDGEKAALRSSSGAAQTISPAMSRVNGFKQSFVDDGTHQLTGRNDPRNIVGDVYYSGYNKSGSHRKHSGSPTRSY